LLDCITYYIITSPNTPDVIRQEGIYVFRISHTINADCFPELYCHWSL